MEKGYEFPSLRYNWTGRFEAGPATTAIWGFTMSWTLPLHALEVDFLKQVDEVWLVLPNDAQLFGKARIGVEECLQTVICM